MSKEINKDIIKKIESKDEKEIIEILNLIIRKEEFIYSPDLETDEKEAFKETVASLTNLIQIEYSDYEFEEINLKEDIINREVKESDYPNPQVETED